jgi:hypothetical protein
MRRNKLEFLLKTLLIMLNTDHSTCFKKNTAKIVEIDDHNIEPWSLLKVFTCIKH